jgi:hypothetical protein
MVKTSAGRVSTYFDTSPAQRWLKPLLFLGYEDLRHCLAGYLSIWDFFSKNL